MKKRKLWATRLGQQERDLELRQSELDEQKKHWEEKIFDTARQLEEEEKALAAIKKEHLQSEERANSNANRTK